MRYQRQNCMSQGQWHSMAQLLPTSAAAAHPFAENRTAASLVCGMLEKVLKIFRKQHACCACMQAVVLVRRR
jgi:hypothetical protein